MSATVVGACLVPRSDGAYSQYPVSPVPAHGTNTQPSRLVSSRCTSSSKANPSAREDSSPRSSARSHHGAGSLLAEPCSLR
ncbi:hypothetical protein [Saccharopolyspora gregorii]|uniref:hypothetical protein n=1 Tax=Saccharopolyspora gregorii TaxID=33914 RepID=UPI0031E94E8F